MAAAMAVAPTTQTVVTNNITMEKTEISYLHTHLIEKSGCNQRLQLDEFQISKMTTTLLNKQWLPPIYVRIEGNKYGCYDGIHRLEAYKRCNVPYLPAIIKNVSDTEATTISYISGCGKVWSEAEKAITCLKLYQSGKSVKQIITELALAYIDQANESLSEKAVNTYIKIAAYLHPDLLKLVRKGNNKGKGVPITAADLLAHATPEDQIQMYNELSILKGTKATIITQWYNSNKYHKIPRNIRNLQPASNSGSLASIIQPKHTTPTISTQSKITPSVANIPAMVVSSGNTPVSQTLPPALPQTPQNEHSKFVQSIKMIIDNYCVNNHCNRDVILGLLK